MVDASTDKTFPMKMTIRPICVKPSKFIVPAGLQ